MPRMIVRQVPALLAVAASLALGPGADAKATAHHAEHHTRHVAHHARHAKKVAKKPAPHWIKTKPPVAHRGGAGNGTRVGANHKPSITRVGSPSTDRAYPSPDGIPAISKGKE